MVSMPFVMSQKDDFQNCLKRSEQKKGWIYFFLFYGKLTNQMEIQMINGKVKVVEFFPSATTTRTWIFQRPLTSDHRIKRFHP